MVMQEERDESIMREFRRRRSRQLYAVGMVIFLLVAVLWKHSHPGLILGELSKSVVLFLEIALVGAFVAFSASNWRCPACNHYLGPNIAQEYCRKCRSRLQ